MDRLTLRNGAEGQQVDLSGQTAQSVLRDLYIRRLSLEMPERGVL